MKKCLVVLYLNLMSLMCFAQGQHITISNLKKIAETERVSTITSFVKQFGYKLSKTEQDEDSQEIRWELSSNSDYEIILTKDSKSGKIWVAWYTPSASVFERFKRDIIAAGYKFQCDLFDEGISSLYEKDGSNISFILREEPIDLDESSKQYFRIEITKQEI